MAVLVLIGFGSCVNRPMKSKAPENEPEEVVEADSLRGVDVIPDMRMMYGVQRVPFQPEKAVREKDAPAEDTETPATPAE